MKCIGRNVECLQGLLPPWFNELALYNPHCSKTHCVSPPKPSPLSFVSSFFMVVLEADAAQEKDDISTLIIIASSCLIREGEDRDRDRQ